MHSSTLGGRNTNQRFVSPRGVPLVLCTRWSTSVGTCPSVMHVAIPLGEAHWLLCAGYGSVSSIESVPAE